MAARALIERYAANLHGMRSCHDRIIVTGTSPGACYAGGMTRFLYSRGIRIFDYPKFAEPLRDRIRERAHAVCASNGVSIEGRCIKHCMGAAGVKVYDKFSRVVRVETTVNDVRLFKHHRKVEHKQGYSTRELAPLKKSIYSLIDLREILLGCNQRYLALFSPVWTIQVPASVTFRA